MGLSNYNSNSVKWNIDNKDFSYFKVSELIENKEYPLCGFFISKDNGYGEGAVLITSDCNINIPARYVPVLRSMMSDNTVIDEINSGRGYFSYEKFKSEKYNREGYRLTFGAYPVK